MTSTGTQYRLPDSPLHYAVTASLSPDGTRLLFVQDGHSTIRDLTGTATLDLGAFSDNDYTFAAFWSGDSSRLAFPSGSGIDVVTVTTGQRAALHAPANQDAKLCGVRASGDVLVCSQDRVPFRAGVFVLDGRTGAVKSQRVVNVKAQLTAAEQHGDQINTSVYDTVFPLADGDAFLLRLNPYDPVHGVTNGGDLLLVDMATGNIRRLPLPEQKSATPGRSPAELPSPPSIAGTSWRRCTTASTWPTPDRPAPPGTPSTRTWCTALSTSIRPPATGRSSSP